MNSNELRERANRLHEISMDYLGVNHERYAELARMATELYAIAEERDPLKPEPGWYAVLVLDITGERWMVGYFDGRALYKSESNAITDAPLVGKEYIYEYRRILGPRQLAVELPPVSEWSDQAHTMQIQYVPRDVDGFPFGAVTVMEITRNQAERMEADDE